MDDMEVLRLRLERAAEHIAEFCDDADAFLRGQPFRIVSEYYAEGDTQFVRLLFRVDRSPPKRLGVIAGDCIHNLRAILDNIVWSLGKAYPTNDSKAKSERLAFSNPPSHVTTRTQTIRIEPFVRNPLILRITS